MRALAVLIGLEEAESDHGDAIPTLPPKIPTTHEPIMRASSMARGNGGSSGEFFQADTFERFLAESD